MIEEIEKQKNSAIEKKFLLFVYSKLIKKEAFE